MDQCFESTARHAWQAPTQPRDNGPALSVARAAGQPARTGPGVICSALRYLAKAVEDLETMLFPFPDLLARRPCIPAAPQVRHDREDGVAAADVKRNAPLIRRQLNAWINRQAPGTVEAGARIFCDHKPGEWTPLTAHLADLVVADCGPRLAQLAREVISGAGRQIESSVRRDSPEDQAGAVVTAVANEICAMSGTMFADNGEHLLSPDLRAFLLGVRKDVQDWTLRHSSSDWGPAGLPGAHVVGNVLFACGFRAVVEQLRREAQSQPPTPSSRWIEGRGGAARASEADLYGMLEAFCLDLTHGQRQLLADNHSLTLAAKVGKTAHPAAKQFHSTLAYSKDLKQLQAATVTAGLMKPAKRGSTAVVHPLGLASPQGVDAQRTPSSRSESRHSELSADEFATRERHPAQEPRGSDD